MDFVRRFSVPVATFLAGAGLQISGYENENVAYAIWVLAGLLLLIAFVTWPPIQQHLPPVSIQIGRRKPVIAAPKPNPTLKYDGVLWQEGDRNPFCLKDQTRLSYVARGVDRAWTTNDDEVGQYNGYLRCVKCGRTYLLTKDGRKKSVGHSANEVANLFESKRRRSEL